MLRILLRLIVSAAILAILLVLMILGFIAFLLRVPQVTAVVAAGSLNIGSLALWGLVRVWRRRPQPAVELSEPPAGGGLSRTDARGPGRCPGAEPSGGHSTVGPGVCPNRPGRRPREPGGRRVGPNVRVVPRPSGRPLPKKSFDAVPKLSLETETHGLLRPAKPQVPLYGSGHPCAAAPNELPV